MSGDVAIQQVLAQIRAISAQTQAPGASPAAPAEGAGEFARLLKSGIDAVNRTQQEAGRLADAFQRGEPGVELAEVMIGMQKASVSFRALTEVRNRMVEAYREIMNMTI